MPRPKADPSQPNVPGTKILLALARHHALTIPQTAELCFSPSSVSYAHEHLLRLTQHGYVRREPASEKGIADAFLLNEAGKRYLTKIGVTIDEATGHKPPRGMHMPHRLAVTSLLIKLERSGHPILERRNEWQLSRQSVKLTLADGTKVGYAPDGWVRMLIDEREVGIAIELDRGTEHQDVWRRKVQEIAAFTSLDKPGGEYPFTRLFGVERIRFAIVAGPGAIGTVAPELRARNLVQWTALELKRIGKPSWGKLLYIRPLDPETVTPESLLFDPCWAHPGEEGYVPLIGGTA